MIHFAGNTRRGGVPGFYTKPVTNVHRVKPGDILEIRATGSTRPSLQILAEDPGKGTFTVIAPTAVIPCRDIKPYTTIVFETPVGDRQTRISAIPGYLVVPPVDGCTITNNPMTVRLPGDKI